MSSLARNRWAERCTLSGTKMPPGAQKYPKSDPEGPKTSNKLPKRHIWDPGPVDCAKRLQSARPLCLQRGTWGVLEPRLDSCLFLTPLEVSPVAPRIPLYPSSSAPLWTPFFQSFTELTNSARIITFCLPQAPKMKPKSGKKRSANLFDQHLQKTKRVLQFPGPQNT